MDIFLGGGIEDGSRECLLFIFFLGEIEILGEVPPQRCLDKTL